MTDFCTDLNFAKSIRPKNCHTLMSDLPAPNSETRFISSQFGRRSFVTKIKKWSVEDWSKWHLIEFMIGRIYNSSILGMTIDRNFSGLKFWHIKALILLIKIVIDWDFDEDLLALTAFPLIYREWVKRAVVEGFGGRADASDTRGLWFESHLNVIWK